MTEDISARISALQAGPKELSFKLVYDDANKIWLGKGVGSFYWLLEQSWEEKERHLSIVAEGATPSEVLRKLAGLME